MNVKLCQLSEVMLIDMVIYQYPM